MVVHELMVAFTDGTCETWGAYKIVHREKRHHAKSAFVALKAVRPGAVIQTDWPTGPWRTVRSITQVQRTVNA